MRVYDGEVCARTSLYVCVRMLMNVCVRTCVYMLTYKCVLCGNTMTNIIQTLMEAGPHVRGKHGYAAAAQWYAASDTSRRHHVFRRRSLQPLHLLLMRLWAHMHSPPQSRQRRLMRLCSQMLAPPQSLHLLMWLCSQMLAPPQSFQVLLWRYRCS